MSGVCAVDQKLFIVPRWPPKDRSRRAVAHDAGR
jgi:hypothetical protein